MIVAQRYRTHLWRLRSVCPHLRNLKHTQVEGVSLHVSARVKWGERSGWRKSQMRSRLVGKTQPWRHDASAASSPASHQKQEDNKYYILYLNIYRFTNVFTELTQLNCTAKIYTDTRSGCNKVFGRGTGAGMSQETGTFRSAVTTIWSGELLCNNVKAAQIVPTLHTHIMSLKEKPL